MLFMVVETFVQGRQAELYRRVRESGRGIPEGLEYVGSWVDAGLSRCWQLMRTDDAALLQEWVAASAELCSFEIVPVTESREVQALMARLDAG